MRILDTTIRDGSYAVNFRFSCDDVAEIVKRLEKLGIEYIEIGHGMGLNASSYENGIALHSDEEYMKTAQACLTKAKYGFFCIPGIARIEDLHLAKKYGVSFIRVGVSVNDAEKAIPYIKEANSLGIEVMLNFMKSYIVSPEEFARKAYELAEYGVETVYVVDSAGSMLEEEIGAYYDAIRERGNMQVGFHGHNNLGLAVSNSIYCMEKGFEWIDCSLQGLGRSIGNTSLEQFVMTLKRKGYPIEMDIPRLLEYGYVSLKGVTNRELQNPLDLICGYTGFHSSYLKHIYRCCNEKKVDPLRLIIAYSDIDREKMDYEKLCLVAEKLPRDEDRHPYSFRDYFSIEYSR